MIKPIVKDIFFLRRKAEEATREDIQVGIDLQDTLRANREACVGMAANMIGVNKRVIIVNMGFVDVVMFNPVLIKKDTPYETEEGCLSLTGGYELEEAETETQWLDGTDLPARAGSSGGNHYLIRGSI